MGSRLAKVKTGVIEQPMFVVFYGPDGVGKTTWAAGAPKPVIVGPEKGSAALKIARLHTKTYDDVVETIKELINDPHDYKTCIIDTIDWIEPLMWKKICSVDNKPMNATNGGFHAGYAIAKDHWWALIDLLEELRTKRDMHIIALAHARIKPFNDPTQPAPYDRYQMKLHITDKEDHSSMWREACDFMLFANFEVLATRNSEKDKKMKTHGDGSRNIFTERREMFDAKQRYKIPFELEFPAKGAWDLFFAAVEKAKNNPDPEIEVGIDDLKKEIEEFCKTAPQDLLERMVPAIKRAGEDVTQLQEILNHGRIIMSERD